MTRKITFRSAGPSLFALALAMPMAMSPIAAPPAHALFGIGDCFIYHFCTPSPAQL